MILSENDKVDISYFDVIKVLGTGAYGKVYLVRKKSGHDMGQLYAMKVLKKATVVQKKKTAEHTKTERQVLEAVRSCPFLVRMYYAFQTEAKLYLILGEWGYFVGRLWDFCSNCWHLIFRLREWR